MNRIRFACEDCDHYDGAMTAAEARQHTEAGHTAV
jgi:hypothetical protein